MPVDITRARKRDTIILSVLVALGVIVALVAGEFVLRHWLDSGAREGSSPGSHATARSSAPSITSIQQPEPEPAPAANPSFPSLNRLGCKPGDSRCSGKRSHPTPSKPPANAVASSREPEPSSAQGPPEPPAAAQQSRTQEDPRDAEERLRATEDSQAQLVALEREELDHLTGRANLVFDRVAAAQRQQPAQGRQLRDDLAFGQQRLQSDLNQAEAALKTADVQGAQKYMDMAKSEIEKLGKLLARQ
jgi:hypothetical protein